MIRAVVFDVNETLFPLAPVGRHLQRLGLPEDDLERWFAAVLLDGIAASAAGTFADFGSLARHHVSEQLAAHGLAADAVNQADVLSAFDEVVPHGDVAPALMLLDSLGLTVATLTNGSASMTRAFLDRADLADLVDHVWDVSEVGLWKPRPEPYHWAVRKLRLTPPEVAMVAVHPWDVHGAGVAGLRTGWVDRSGMREFPSALRMPDTTGRTLIDVVGRLAPSE